MDEAPKKKHLCWSTSDSRMPFRNVPFLLPTSEMKYWRLSLSNSTLHWTYCCNDRTEIISSHYIFPLFERKKCWTTALMPKFKVWGIPFKKLMTQIHNCWPKISRTKQNFSFSHKINSCFQHTLLTSTSGILNTCETFFSLQKYNKISIRISTTWLYQQDREDSLELNYRPMNCI